MYAVIFQAYLKGFLFLVIWYLTKKKATNSHAFALVIILKLCEYISAIASFPDSDSDLPGNNNHWCQFK